MTGFFRNPEIRRELLIWIAGSAVFCAAGFFTDIACGWLMLCACFVFSAAHFIVSYLRYRRIRDLSLDIDRVLHGKDFVRISGYEEGELAVLQSELGKMTVRFREYAEGLQKDKVWLTDAIADISHQLRTPLTAMNLIVSMLASSNLTDARRLELSRELKQLLARIDWLVETLLKMSKIDAGTVYFKREPVPVAELIRKAAEPLTIAMEVRGQTLSVRDDAAIFHGDLAWTAEAVGNILKNCAEHTPEGGGIRVDAAKTALYTEIKIRDTGPGIDAADLPHLFERFYKGRNAAGGSFGIGLALARMIIIGQDGTIKAENNPGGGAMFTVRFYDTH
jgi:signal transduction histidine kinase